jgi:hypothetical protein
MEHGLKLEKKHWVELLTTEHSGTTSCARCTGLLVSDWFYDLENPGEYYVKALRCVQCGHRVDPTIARNRIRPPLLRNREGQLEDQRSMNGEHWEDAGVTC